MAPSWHEISRAAHGSVTVDNVLLFASRAPTGATVIDGIRRRLVELGGKHPGGGGYIHIIHHENPVPAPDDDARQAFLDMIRCTVTTKVGLVVILGAEFGAAAARATVSTILVAGQGKQPLRIYRSLDEGAAWFAGALRAAGASCPAERDLVDAGDELIRRIEPA